MIFNLLVVILNKREYYIHAHDVQAHLLANAQRQSKQRYCCFVIAAERCMCNVHTHEHTNENVLHVTIASALITMQTMNAVKRARRVRHTTL